MDLDALIPCIRGTLTVERDARGLTPKRLTAAQYAHFAPNEAWSIRANCPAGVALCGRTASPWIELDLHFGPHCRGWFALDVEVDGVLRQTVREDGPPERWRGRIDLPGDGERAVRIALPLTCATTIASAAVADGAGFEPLEERRHRYLAIGDSITQGMTGSGMASSYAWRLADLLGADLLDQGIGGHIFDAASFDPTLGVEPDLVTIAYGTNDWSRGLGRDAIVAAGRGHLGAIRARFPRVPIACLSPVWRSLDDPARWADFVDCGRGILELASELEGVLPVDGLRLVPHREDRFVDGVHPNDGGFAEYAGALHQALVAAGVAPLG